MGRSIDKSLKAEIPSEYCYYCGRKLNASNRTYDHVIPVDKGGKDETSNLVACCSECNQVKKNYTLYELVRALNCQKKFCDDDVRTATLEYQIKIFSIARERLKA
jgi:HNH endonuclease.